MPQGGKPKQDDPAVRPRRNLPGRTVSLGVCDNNLTVWTGWGESILLCCKGCVTRFMSDPDKYLAKLNRWIVQDRTLARTTPPEYNKDSMWASHEASHRRCLEISSMAGSARLARWLITSLLAIGLAGSGLRPCFRPHSMVGATGCSPRQSANGRSCCMTAGQSDCGMASCRTETPAKSPARPPRHGNQNTFDAKAPFQVPLAWMDTDAQCDGRIASVLLDLTSHAVSPTLRSQHVCLQV